MLISMHSFLSLALLSSLAAQDPVRVPRPSANLSGVVAVGPPRSMQYLTLPTPFSRNRNTTQDAEPQNETWIALDPAAPLNLVGATNDYRLGDAQAGVSRSFDGGTSWSASTLAALNPLSAKYDAQGDPSVSGYPGGVFFYSYIDFNRGDNQNRLCVARSSDGGLSWPVVGVVVDDSGPSPAAFEDKALAAVDATGGAFDGNVYVTWTRFTSGFSADRIMLSRSVDGGLTYSAPAPISDSINGYQGAMPAIGPHGEVFVAWYHNGAIEFDDSGDGGANFTTDVVVSAVSSVPSPLPGAAFRLNSFPALAVDAGSGPMRGNLYVVWADRLGTGSGPDVVLSRSIDGGVSWSPPIRVSDDTNGSYQFFPAIAVAPNGVLTVSFFDERNGPHHGNYDVYVAQSLDGGVSFRPNVKVSSETSHSSLDGFGGGFIGDYSGLAVTNTTVYPLWTDVRPSNGNAEAYTRALLWRRF